MHAWIRLLPWLNKTDIRRWNSLQNLPNIVIGRTYIIIGRMFCQIFISFHRLLSHCVSICVILILPPCYHIESIISKHLSLSSSVSFSYLSFVRSYWSFSLRFLLFSFTSCTWLFLENIHKNLHDPHIRLQFCLVLDNGNSLIFGFRPPQFHTERNSDNYCGHNRGRREKFCVETQRATLPQIFDLGWKENDIVRSHATLLYFYKRLYYTQKLLQIRDFVVQGVTEERGHKFQSMYLADYIIDHILVLQKKHIFR